MTRLEREIVRAVIRASRTPLVMRLVHPRGEEPARIEFREYRTRKWFSLPLEAVFIEAVRRDVQRMLGERRRAGRGRGKRGSLLRGAA
jgi:hypothetical protein